MTTETTRITAEDLRVGDVWVSEHARLTVEGLQVQDGWLFAPWGAGRLSPPVAMTAVQVAGTIERDDVEKPFSGTWTLQADQPLDVERDPTCGYCGDNPAEPGLPCCDAQACRAEHLRELAESEAG